MKIYRFAMGLALLFVVCLLPSKAVQADSGTNYAYTYDFWGLERESPSPYNPDKVVFGVDLGIGNFKDPQGLYARGQRIYVADSGNNRVVECDADMKLIRVIDGFMLDGAQSKLNYPSDVFAADNGDIYICDTNNYRVVHLDKDLNLVNLITKPQDALLGEASEFLPLKLVVDNADRVYLLAKNVNKGIMEFDTHGSFTGYVGANKVSYNIWDYVWKSLATRAQKDQMVLFVPTEYSNIALDRQGFFYTTTNTISEADIMNMFQDQGDMASMMFGSGKKSNVDPIRRLNAMGADILIKNGWFPPVGDIDWGDAGDVSGPSKFVDIVPIENDSYLALDMTRGRIFAYDFQGNLLYAFGGLGNKAGYFQFPTAIESADNNILVLDGRSGGVTVFKPTEYGSAIHGALSEYIKGNYEKSADLWEQVLVYNANYDLAYIGIGRSLLRQDRYKEAMEYFKLKCSYDNYSKAFQQYRKQVIEQNIGYIMGGLITLYITGEVIKLVRRIRRKEGGQGHNGTQGTA